METLELELYISSSWSGSDPSSPHSPPQTPISRPLPTITIQPPACPPPLAPSHRARSSTHTPRVRRRRCRRQKLEASHEYAAEPAARFLDAADDGAQDSRSRRTALQRKFRRQKPAQRLVRIVTFESRSKPEIRGS